MLDISVHALNYVTNFSLVINLFISVGAYISTLSSLLIYLYIYLFKPLSCVSLLLSSKNNFEPKNEIWSVAYHFTCITATILNWGRKSKGYVQCYLLMSLSPVPAPFLLPSPSPSPTIVFLIFHY